MKAITTEGWGLKPKLVLGDLRSPMPGPDDVLIGVHAASVNPKDWKLNLTGSALATPLFRGLLPPLFGDDLAGEVIATGSNVKDFAIGDKVFGMDMKPRTASLAEQAIISQRCIAHMPEGLSYADAAAMPLAALTALQGLRIGKAEAGSNVLIIGASGGVGSYAIQIAKALGASVTAVCSGRNIELVTSLGADTVIDYTLGDFRQTSGSFDLVFDVASYETPGSCATLMGDHGHFVSTFGQMGGLVSTLIPIGKRVHKVVVDANRKDMETLATMFTKGELKSVIDSQFSLADSQAAYERSQSGRARGKIVILVKE